MTEDNDAKDQAKAQYESICQMLGALDVDYDRLEELKDEEEVLLKAIENVTTEFDMDEAEADFLSWRVESAEELKELSEAAGDCESQDEAQERIDESPLSVQIRSDWVSPGDDMTAYEFEILLCCGGPAVRIRGELDEHNQADRAWIEYQDWGTQWTPYHGAEQATLLAYANQFFYGE